MSDFELKDVLWKYLFIKCQYSLNNLCCVKYRFSLSLAGELSSHKSKIRGKLIEAQHRRLEAEKTGGVGRESSAMQISN